MNQNLSQSRREREENWTVNITNPRESKVGSFRRKRPKLQARRCRPQCQEKSGIRRCIWGA